MEILRNNVAGTVMACDEIIFHGVFRGGMVKS